MCATARVQNLFHVIIAVISTIIAIIWNPPLSVQWRRFPCLESNYYSWLTYMTDWLALGKFLKTLPKSLWFVALLLLSIVNAYLCFLFVELVCFSFWWWTWYLETYQQWSCSSKKGHFSCKFISNWNSHQWIQLFDCTSWENLVVS